MPSLCEYVTRGYGNRIALVRAQVIITTSHTQWEPGNEAIMFLSQNSPYLSAGLSLHSVTTRLPISAPHLLMSQQVRRRKQYTSTVERFIMLLLLYLTSANICSFERFIPPPFLHPGVLGRSERSKGLSLSLRWALVKEGNREREARRED